MDKLQELRDRIDSLDQQLVQLLNERAACAVSIGKLKLADFHNQIQKKTKNNVGSQTADKVCNYYHPQREQQVLAKVKQANRGPISDELLARLYREIISISLSLEKPLKIAYLGPEATFSHMASIKHFGSAMDHLPAGSIEQVFRQVERNFADFGVVPIENSTSGMIHITQDCLIKTNASVCGQVELNVEHHLLTKAKSLSDLETVYAHPQAFRQCRNWLALNLPLVKQKSTTSNSAGANIVSAKDAENVAAISSYFAAQQFNLPILESNIEDVSGNTTRFYVIGKQQSPKTEKDKTLIYFSVKQEAGSLVKALKAFSDQGINMTLLTSRPSPDSSWEYIFFVEAEGHYSNSTIKASLKNMHTYCHNLRMLGSFSIAS